MMLYWYWLAMLARGLMQDNSHPWQSYPSYAEAQEKWVTVKPVAHRSSS